MNQKRGSLSRRDFFQFSFFQAVMLPDLFGSPFFGRLAKLRRNIAWLYQSLGRGR